VKFHDQLIHVIVSDDKLHVTQPLLWGYIFFYNILYTVIAKGLNLYLMATQTTITVKFHSLRQIGLLCPSSLFASLVSDISMTILHLTKNHMKNSNQILLLLQKTPLVSPGKSSLISAGQYHLNNMKIRFFLYRLLRASTKNHYWYRLI
jgi:hypothetical protein